MPSEDRPTAPLGVLASLRAGLNAGALVGVLAGLCDGAVNAFGIDTANFFLRVQARGWGTALFGGLPEWGGFQWFAGLLGCLAASAFLYGVLGVVLGLACGFALHPVLKGRTAGRRYRTILGLGFGVWLFFEVYWWTRAVVFPGLPATDPRRLAAAGAMLALGLAAGFGLALSGKRMPLRLRVATPFLVLATFLAGGLYLLADSAGGSAQRGELNERNRDLPNVLIFIVDALRQDVLGCYGAERVKTPVIDALAARGVVFEEAFVQAPFTWSSFGSLLTGKYPRRHGLVRMAPGVRMAPNVTLPWHLKGARRLDGVQLEEEDFVGTAFMTGTLSHGSGLLRGFDVYFEALVGHDLVDVHSRWSRFRSGLILWLVKNKLAQRVDDQIVASTARRWFAENAHRRFVSLVHYYSTHTPYDPPAEFRAMYLDPEYAGPLDAFRAEHRIAIEAGGEPSEADAKQIRDLYYAGVTEADAMIGEVLDELERQGVLDDTIVVVTSDHGEELGDHGLWEHNFMYQTNLRIPLVMAWPGGLPANRRVTAIVDTIDLVPTLCELMGLEPPSDPELGERGRIDGASLVPLIRAEVERVRPYSFAENGRFRSIQDARRKLIVRREALADGGWEAVLAGEAKKPRFFDLAADPGETENLFDARTDEAHELYLALKEWSDSMPIGDHLVLRTSRDAEAELLNALGYGGGVGEGLEDEE